MDGSEYSWRFRIGIPWDVAFEYYIKELTNSLVVIFGNIRTVTFVVMIKAKSGHIVIQSWTTDSQKVVRRMSLN